jgi:hypothetical protein
MKASRRLRKSYSVLRHCVLATSLLCFLAILFGPGSDSQAGVVVYDFVNFSFQNGYTIYGEIVTDGVIGFLSANDIQSSPDPTSGANSPFAATSLSISNTGPTTPLPAYFVQFNNLYADATGNLWAGYGTVAGSVGIGDYNEADTISYFDNGPGSYSYDHATVNYGHYAWSDSGNFFTGPLAGAPLLIATAAPSVSSVPEPASLTIWGSLGLAGLFWRRWRRQGGARFRANIAERDAA